MCVCACVCLYQCEVVWLLPPPPPPGTIRRRPSPRRVDPQSVGHSRSPSSQIPSPFSLALSFPLPFVTAANLPSLLSLVITIRLTSFGINLFSHFRSR